ncbi:hypothetical protein C6W91_17350 [Phaeobacter sp. SYSU ZJ3003]
MRCGDTREEERCRRSEQHLAKWEERPNVSASGSDPGMRCGDTREEERCRRSEQHLAKWEEGRMHQVPGLIPV